MQKYMDSMMSLKMMEMMKGGQRPPSKPQKRVDFDMSDMFKKSKKKKKKKKRKRKSNAKQMVMPSAQFKTVDFDGKKIDF